MSAVRIKKGDTVKVIAGKDKGKTGKVMSVNAKNHTALVKMIWDHARQTEKAVYDADEELTAETKLARAKYEFLYREAKLRKVHGHIQSSVFGK